MRTRFGFASMNPKKYLGLIVLVLLCLSAPAHPMQAPEAGPLILAVHPYLPHEELMQRFLPLARYLGNRIDRKILVRVGRDYEEHETHIGNNQVDIAFMGPASYVKMTECHGVKPLLARLEVKGKAVFRGAVVTRADSGIARLGAMKGRHFAFGDPLSTMSHLVPRYMLLQAGIGLQDLADYKYLGSHSNVALGVLSGDFDAGAVKEEVYRKYESRGLRVMAWTPTLSEHLFVVRDTLPPATVQELRDALLALGDPETEGGRWILGSIKSGVTGMARVQDSDYDNLRLILYTLQEATP